MSFYETPEVDDNSKRSEESVNAVRSWFTRRNGFIFRSEEPDYGVDVDVELIVSEKAASSWKFPIQIKSSGRLKIVNENGIDFISLPFVVSRLGYLAKRLPASGIILIYDDEAKIGYFDYVEAVIRRLDDHPAREDWREQKSVNILLPLQEVCDEKLSKLHRTMVDRHQNHEKLVEKHGSKFSIPYLQVKEQQPAEFDLTDPKEAIAFLEKYGIFLFNEQEYPKLVTLFESMSHAAISDLINTLFLATITYTRIGNVVEADYYLRKIEKRWVELTVEQQGIVRFSQIRMDFLKGNCNYSGFLVKLTELQENVEGLENQLTVAINVLYFEIHEISLDGNFDINVKDKIDQLTERIMAPGLSKEQQYLLLTYHAENINAFALEAFLYFNSSFQLSQSLKIDMPLDTRIAFARLSTAMLEQATKFGLDAYRFAETNELFLLQATAAHNLGKFFFQTKYYLLMQGIEDNTSAKESTVLDYRRYYAFSVIAYNHFIKLHMQQSAHEAVTNAYELRCFCLKLHSVQIGTKSSEELMALIRKLETENDLTPFKSAAEYIMEVKARNKSGNPTSMSDMSDATIKALARQSLEVFNLPEERLQNIVTELNAIRLFENRCKNPNIELLSNNSHLISRESRYKSPPSFVLSHKQFKYQTPSSDDIEQLLEQFKHLLK